MKNEKSGGEEDERSGREGMSSHDIQERTFAFACSVVNLCKKGAGLDAGTRIIKNQLLRSATSIGANMEEASVAQSKADFISKCSIALKEAREARYWIRLMIATEATMNLNVVMKESSELIAILTTILINARRNRTTGVH